MSTEDSRSKQRVLVAYPRTAWRDELVAALANEGIEADPIDDGVELQQSLADDAGPSAAYDCWIVGGELERLAVVDALFLSSTSNKRRVLFVTDVRADLVYLDLLRKRGADGFLYADDAIQHAIGTVVGLLQGRRAADRLRVALDAEVGLDGGQIVARTSDISPSGAGLTLRVGQAPPSLVAGANLIVTLFSSDATPYFVCPARVRWVSTERRLLSKRVRIGVQFLPDETVRDRIAEALKDIRRLDEMGAGYAG